MTAPRSSFANKPLLTGEEYGDCRSLLCALLSLPIPERQNRRSIILSRSLMETQSQGDREDDAVGLAGFLLRWEELQVITLPMPRDMNAIGDTTAEYDDWSWTLHRILLRAFGRGHFREIRLWHPGLTSDFSTVFLFHNIAEYVEEWVLPLEARRQLKVRRAQYYHSQYAEQQDNQPRDSASAVNAVCERVWAQKGILIRREVESQGTTLVMRWRYDWMRERRQDLTPEELKRPILWTDWTTQPAPFLRELKHCRVLCCTEHGNCFARDGLKYHLIHQHGATEEETLKALSMYPAEILADTWNEIVQPRDGEKQILALPVIQGYSCPCGYRTATKEGFVQHGQETNHFTHPNRAASLFQTLSSSPGQVKYFVVRMRDDFVFPLAGSYGLSV
ncbi:uncharacterized protein CDV56_107529 [Aspergillus thermomutatus]|uniref:Uncharacterized protein n=1 Tax=Aspergillus thermomutatus TaxID=41047 RepID=A0A397H5K7_ASPTH|nr:uncharacterized protein CDV56_107529 [Aspergillus thermomutatus]RHZ56693.1 hypothetical protein CDV56_107529 [Aspergillus thermomutatus]